MTQAIPGHGAATSGAVTGRPAPSYGAGGYMTTGQRRDRLAERLAEVSLWRDRAWADIDGWTLDGTALALGAAWPDRRGVHRLAARGVTVPGHWPVGEVRLDLALGGEGLLHITGPGEDSHYGLDPYHHRFPLRGRQADLEVDIVGRFPFGEPNRAPRLERARLAWEDTAVEQFARQLALVLEAVEVVGDGPAGALLTCAERALASVDWPSRTADYVARVAGSDALQGIWELPAGLDPAPPGLTDEERASVARSSRQLAADLAAAKEAHPPQGDLLLTGHAHLDMAWLWPLAETRRKARRTAWTVVNLMDRYPEFRFNQSSAQLYEFIAEDDPELAARIDRAVAAGQWEPVGGMWVEADGNLPCGESFARQLLYGQRAFARRFGAVHQVGWLPDTFGFSPGLPQLLRSAGLEGLFLQKLNRADTNPFPHDLYWWEGLDGTRLLVHGFDNPHGSYDAMLGPDAFARTWENFRGKHVHPQSLLSIGYGDGGGGPTADMIEKSRLLAGFPALPRAAFGTVAGLFERMRATAEHAALPVWSGELYLEFHRGTYTAQGRLKRLHRQAERDLVAAEAAGALVALAGGPAEAGPPGELTAAWQALLLNQ
ncbi:MAG TPA: alpha-mannosidase, partial [Streptosporangiaceae bacterium]|nr:alpha-mannosidase [Streptosporangiaceae bacterium]